MRPGQEDRDDDRVIDRQLSCRQRITDSLILPVSKTSRRPGAIVVANSIAPMRRIAGPDAEVVEPCRDSRKRGLPMSIARRYLATVLSESRLLELCVEAAAANRRVAQSLAPFDFDEAGPWPPPERESARARRRPRIAGYRLCRVTKCSRAFDIAWPADDTAALGWSHPCMRTSDADGPDD